MLSSQQSVCTIKRLNSSILLGASVPGLSARWGAAQRVGCLSEVCMANDLGTRPLKNRTLVPDRGPFRAVTPACQSSQAWEGLPRQPTPAFRSRRSSSQNGSASFCRIPCVALRARCRHAAAWEPSLPVLCGARSRTRLPRYVPCGTRRNP